jgi:ribosomal protein S18 acetylase RimI-like enzyme
MTTLPETLFSNPVWSALQSRHRHFAESTESAARYPAEVAPFVAVSQPTAAAMHHLHSLLAPDEPVCIIGQGYPLDEFHIAGTLGVLQMVLPQDVDPPEPDTKEIVELNAAHADEMVALTDLAFPGYFRRRTCEMGRYYGVRSAGELIAMGGERLMMDGYSEISGVCTHPAHREKGLAASLIWHLVRDHRRDGVISWLHVGSPNQRAIDLYARMGFKPVREVTLHRISRQN